MGATAELPDEMVLNNNDFLSINDIVPGSTWVQAFGIDDTSLGGICKISTVLSTPAALGRRPSIIPVVDISRRKPPS
jgi:hypothetical protein